MSELLGLVPRAGLRVEESLALSRTLITEAGSVATSATLQAGEFPPNDGN